MSAGKIIERNSALPVTIAAIISSFFSAHLFFTLNFPAEISSRQPVKNKRTLISTFTIEIRYLPRSDST
jgi:hypothetical protein